MPSKKYPLPDFLVGRCEPTVYLNWLSRKASAHVKRDRKRNHNEATREIYKMAIHEAVVQSKGLDFYTGEPLAWEMISSYDNVKSKEGRREYKKSLWSLPTVDHYGDELSANSFKICAWRTNDCKNDLNHEELLRFCELVIEYHRKECG